MQKLLVRLQPRAFAYQWVFVARATTPLSFHFSNGLVARTTDDREAL